MGTLPRVVQHLGSAGVQKAVMVVVEAKQVGALGREEALKNERKRKRKRAAKSGKSPTAPEGLPSPLTSDPLAIERFGGEAIKSSALHEGATQNEAKALNRTFITVESVLISIAKTAEMIQDKLDKNVGIVTEEMSLVDIAKAGESMAKAAREATVAMTIIMDMHRVVMRDPIRTKPAYTVHEAKQAVPNDKRDVGAALTPMVPDPATASDLLARLATLPHPDRPKTAKRKNDEIAAKPPEPEVVVEAEVASVPAPGVPLPAPVPVIDRPVAKRPRYAPLQTIQPVAGLPPTR